MYGGVGIVVCVGGDGWQSKGGVENIVVVVFFFKDTATTEIYTE